MAEDPPESWLRKANADFDAANVPEADRPWAAWNRYTERLGVLLTPTDPRVLRIFKWFEQKHDKASSQRFGRLHWRVIAGGFAGAVVAVFWTILGLVRLLGAVFLAVLPGQAAAFGTPQLVVLGNALLWLFGGFVLGGAVAGLLWPLSRTLPGRIVVGLLGGAVAGWVIAMASDSDPLGVVGRLVAMLVGVVVALGQRRFEEIPPTADAA